MTPDGPAAAAASTTVDVVVVGGRCAGAPTAMLLARAGLRVRLLERARELRDVVSGHMIKPPGVARLRAWGLLDDLLAAGTPTLTRRTLWIDGEPRTAPALPSQTPALAPRRTVLDPLLLEAAASAGVDVRLGTSVTDVIRRDGRVVGVATTAGTHRARLVVGADGRRSTLARALDATMTWARPPATYAYYAYWTGTGIDGVHAWLQPGLFAGMFPTNDDRALAFIQAPAAGFTTARRDPGEHYRRLLDDRPALRGLLGAGTRAEQLRGIGDLPSFFRRSAGPGWVLIGDAGHHKDPLIARGITDAFRDADLVSDLVTAHWDRPDPENDAALAGYPGMRDHAARPLAEANHTLAGLDRPAHALADLWHAAAALEQRLDPLVPT